MEQPHSFIKTIDGGFAVTGSATSFGVGEADVLLMRLASDWSPMWVRTLGGIYEDVGYGVTQVSVGYVGAGECSSFGTGTSSNAVLIMFDPDWNVLLRWGTGDSGHSDRASSVVPVSEGGCVTAGMAASCGSTMALTSYDNNGTTCVGEQVNLQELVATPEVGGLNGDFTFIELAEMMHEPTVKHPGLNDSTVCRALVLCGDADLSGAVDIDDVVCVVAYIFSGGAPPDPIDTGDVDCSGGIDIDDVDYLAAYVFSGGNAPCDGDGDHVPDC